MWAAYLVVAAFAILCGFFIWLYETGTVIIFEPAMDFAMIIMTAAGLILAGVAALIAVVAVYGYRDIRKRAVEASVAAAVKKAAEVAEPVAARTALEALGTAKGAPTLVDANQIAQTSGSSP